MKTYIVVDEVKFPVDTDEEAEAARVAIEQAGYTWAPIYHVDPWMSSTKTLVVRPTGYCSYCGETNADGDCDCVTEEDPYTQSREEDT